MDISRRLKKRPLPSTPVTDFDDDDFKTEKTPKRWFSSERKEKEKVGRSMEKLKGNKSRVIQKKGKRNEVQQPSTSSDLWSSAQFSNITIPSKHGTTLHETNTFPPFSTCTPSHTDTFTPVDIIEINSDSSSD